MYTRESKRLVGAGFVVRSLKSRLVASSVCRRAQEARPESSTSRVGLKRSGVMFPRKVSSFRIAEMFARCYKLFRGHGFHSGMTLALHDGVEMVEDGIGEMPIVVDKHAVPGQDFACFRNSCRFDGRGREGGCGCDCDCTTIRGSSGFASLP
jgi:hypothetical protein